MKKQSPSPTLEERWSDIPIKTRDKLYHWLHQMHPGKAVNIYDLVSEENRAAFYDFIDYFIKWDNGHDKGSGWWKSFRVGLSEDRKSLKKIMI